MKRSEMIALLAEDLSENHGLDFLTDYPEVVAKDILDLLESKGMLPPLNDWSLHTDGDKADTDNVRYYTWEPEDE
jgi:hypothetical protein